MGGVRNTFQAERTLCTKAWKKSLGHPLELQLVQSGPGQMELTTSLGAVHLLGYLEQIV